MVRMKGWLRRYLMVSGAVAATLTMALLVFRGAVSPDRATGPIVFAWMLAFHSYANRLNTEQHQRVTMKGLIALQKAGVAFRLGGPGEAAQYVGQALQEAAADEMKAKASNPAAPAQVDAGA